MGISGSSREQPLSLSTWDTISQRTTGKVVRSALATSITTYLLSKLWKSNTDQEVVEEALGLKGTVFELNEKNKPSKICEAFNQFFKQFNDEHYQFYYHGNGVETNNRIRNLRCIEDNKEAKIEWDVLSLQPLEIDGKKFTYFKYDFLRTDSVSMGHGDDLELLDVPKGLQQHVGFKAQAKIYFFESMPVPPYTFRADITKV